MFEQAPSFMSMLRTPEHRFEFINPAYQRLIGDRNVIGRTVKEALPDAAEQGFVEILDRVYASGQAYTSRSARYLVQEASDGPTVERFIDFVFQPLRSPDGEVNGIFVQGVDVTDRTKAESALLETESRYRTIVENVDVGICIIKMLFDAEGQPTDYLFLDANRGLTTQAGMEDAVGKRMREIAPQHEQHWFDFYGQVALTGKPGRVELKAEGLGGRWFDVHAIRVGDPDQCHVAVVFTDVTPRKRAEEERSVLSAELAHRLKNSMAMVQAIASQTLKAVEDREAVGAFQERLHALSSAHDILLQQDWESASIRGVLEAVLPSFDKGSRVELEGADIDLGPRSTLSLSLLVHELGTNAVKYGSLSVPEGKVSISWAIEEGNDGPELRFKWCESGGPAVSPPTGRGFGSRLIHLGLVGTGGVDLSYEPQGFSATMRAPLNQIQES